VDNKHLSHEEFSKALRRLEDGLAVDPTNNSLALDGVIQRFEFTFELGWKLLKALLVHEGIQCASPRSCIKESFRSGILADGDSWIQMLEDRNQTSHIYDEAEAKSIYRKIKESYLRLLLELERKADSGSPENVG
jgi:nucleotidyltransferase substrate binding protein (TIGR01987 family)